MFHGDGQMARWTEGQTDMTNLTVAFRDFSNEPKSASFPFKTRRSLFILKLRNSKFAVSLTTTPWTCKFVGWRYQLHAFLASAIDDSVLCFTLPPPHPTPANVIRWRIPEIVLLPWLRETSLFGPYGYLTAVAQPIRSRITDLAVPVHP